MPRWTNLNSQDAIERFLAEFCDFHDACLRQVLVGTETFVAENGSMACPGHLDTSAVLFMQSQNKRLPAVEIKCERVTGVRITPSADGCDSIVNGGTIGIDGDVFRLALYFIGTPLKGEPNSAILVSRRDEPDIEVTSQAIAWRAIPDALGDQLRFGPLEIG